MAKVEFTEEDLKNYTSGGNGFDKSPDSIEAKPYTWRDPKTIPPRQWLYRRHYIRKFVSSTIAPGGLGKSALALLDAVSMTIGRDLLGCLKDNTIPKRKVWYLNLEDPLEEVERRLAAICIFYKVKGEDIGDRLFIAGRETPLVIAKTSKEGVQI